MCETFGKQPIYLDDGQDDDGAAVISTLVVRPLAMTFQACRWISATQYDALSGKS
jgi:hypothetical protein